MNNTGLRKLTDREEEFAQMYAVCRRPSEAYRHAYATGKLKSKDVATNAQHVINRPHVAYRIYELQTAATKKYVTGVVKKKKWLEKIIRIELQTAKKEDDDETEFFIGKPKIAISAIEELNRMEGDHAPKKTELSGTDGAPIVTKEMTKEDYLAVRDKMLKKDDV